MVFTKKIIKSLTGVCLLTLGYVSTAQATLFTTTFNINSQSDAISTNGLSVNSGSTGNFATVVFDSNTNTFTVNAFTLDNFFGAGVWIDALYFESNQLASDLPAGASNVTYVGTTTAITSAFKSTAALPDFTSASTDDFDFGYAFNNNLHDNQSVSFRIDSFNPNCLTDGSGCAKNTNLLSSNAFALRLRGASSRTITYFMGASIDPVSSVPEPQTYATFMAGLGLLGFVSRRKKSV